jgi:hypothetical protein
MVISYRQADELQRLNQLKAASVAFLAMLCGVFAAQMLYAILTINLAIALQVIFIGGIVLWSLVHTWLDRKTSND